MVDQLESPRRLSLLDNSFPDPLSAFRYAEFKSYLSSIEGSIAFCKPGSISTSVDGRALNELIDAFNTENPDLKNRVVSYEHRDLHAVPDELLYFVFLNNVRTFRPDLNQGKPFAFTLYPGGDFWPYTRETNPLLREVFAHSGFRRVIVNQAFSRDYLLNCNFCREEQITLIPGVVVPQEFLLQTRSEPTLKKDELKTVNICFAAYKYSEGGREKGLDIFLDVARRLITTTDFDMRFHLVGDWEKDVLDDTLKPFLTFHGVMQTNALLDFFSEMDVFISPNRSGEPFQGRFDGFPTGTAVQAGLCGVAVFASDCLQQNYYLRDGEEIVVINHSATEIGDVVASWMQDHVRLESLKAAGAKAFRRLYGFEAQMKPRIELLTELLHLRS